MNERVWMIALMIFANPVPSQAQWKIRLASTYELWFYNSVGRTFQQAKELCTGGRVTYMDDADVRNAVYNNIQEARPKFYWIGATGTLYDWTWLNGTPVDTSFITWYTDQPDNGDEKEHNLVLQVSILEYGDIYENFEDAGTICQRQIVFRSGNRKLTIHRPGAAGGEINLTYDEAKKQCRQDHSRLVFWNRAVKAILNPHLKSSEFYWVSGSPSNGMCSGYVGNRVQSEGCGSFKYYICEQIGPSHVGTSDFTVTELGEDELRCTAQGVPVPTVVWWKGTFEIPDSSSQSHNGIYQTKSSGSATLHFENAKVSDEGEYKCVATNTIDESTAISNVKVPSKPTILTIQPHSCNPSLTITWKPHPRAVGVTHSIRVYNDGDDRSQESLDQVVSFNNLTSSTLYHVKVFVGAYSDTNSSYTGGIPQPVEAPTLTKLNGSCKVSWDWPQKTPQSLITGYKVNTTYGTARALPGADRTVEQYNESVSSLSFTIPYRANRNHTVTIESQTCAGSSGAVVASGSCVTDVAAPKSVEKLSVGTGKNVVSEDRTMNFRMKVPNETNGTISCIFVIAATENTAKYNGFTANDLKDVNGTGDGTRYIAIAIERQSIGGRSEVNITLGNGSRSTCNIHNQPKTRRKRDIRDNNSYVGQNNPLSTEKSYKIYVATATPADNNKVFFRISEPLVVQPASHSSTWIVPLVVSLAAIFLLATGAVVVIFLKRRNAPKEAQPEKRDFGSENAQANGTEKPAAGPRVHIPSFPSAPVAVNTEQGQALYENRKDDTTFRMSDFEEYYKRLCQENCSLFKSQFKTIKELSAANKKSTSFAAKPDLKKKNRYKNILPYDSTRVVIKGNDTGYINACYVDGFHRERKFIATQGPLASTENDFWLMVVENDCKMIVMVAKCFEAGKKKCQKYWPDEGKTEKYGKITVQNATEIKSCGFIQRKFRVSTDNETTNVQQFQYLNWPDHGIPNTTSSLVRMHKAAMTSLKQEKTVTPVIVHCSAGAGRTGTFIGYDYLLEQSSSEDQADVLKCVLMMRSHRVDMIQTCDQYILVHKLVLEHYLFADTDLDPQDITQKFHDMERGSAARGLAKEFGDLSRLAPVKNISSQENEDCNVVLIIPRPREPSPPSLNASWVESYDENSPMMAAEAPDRISSSLFWRAVSDNRVNTIITLNGAQKKERYWPAVVGEDASFGDVVVNLLSENNNGVVVQRVLQISNGSKQSTVTQYHYSAWDVKNCPKDTRYILELVENMQKNTRKEKGAASVITCSDGIGRSGTYCAIVNLIERLKMENKIDVFRAVKDLRDCRPGMVKTLDQYVFCHRVISDYLKSFDIYSNFG